MFAPHMGDPHGDPQTGPQHADPHGSLVPFFFFLKKKKNHTRNACGSACGGPVCGSPCGSPMWGGQFHHGLLEKSLITYKHPVLTLYGYGKILTEGISLIF